MIAIPLIAGLIIRLLPLQYVFGDVIRFNSVDAYYYVIGYGKWGEFIGLFPDRYIAAVVLPVIFSLINIVVVYFIAKQLFNDKKISIISTVILSIMSGEYLVRTSLGAGDTHALEILLLSTAILFTIMIIRSNHRILYIVPLLVVIYLYALVWQGWLLVLFIMLMAVCLKLLITAQKWYYYILFIGALWIGADMLRFYLPEFASSALSVFTWNTTNTIYEAQPLFIQNGQFTISPLFSNFGLSFCGLIGLMVINKNNFDYVLFIGWTLVLLAMTLAQERFAYYLAVPLSIIAGYTIWYINQGILSKSKFKQVLLYGIIIVPLLVGSVRQNMSNTLYMTDSWVETCQWLKEQPHKTILTWWDYGYYVKEAGHKVLDSPGRPVDSNYQYKPTNEIAEMLTGKRLITADLIIVDEAMVTVKLDHIMKFAKVDDCIGLLLCRLYADEQVDGFKEVFRSNDSKVKVYER